jgi:hypothetical protein
MQSSRFSQILAQLEAEHVRELASLKRELEGQRDNVADGAPREMLPTSRTSATSEGKPVTPRDAMRKSPLANGLNSDSGRGPAQPVTKYPVAVTPASAAAGRGMRWSFSRMPEEDHVAQHVAELMETSSLGRHMGPGFVASIESWVRWWVDMKEPKRPVTCLKRFVESIAFQTACLVAILANTLYIVIATDKDMQKALQDANGLPRDTRPEDYKLILDCFFSAFYTIELLLKLRVHRVWFFLREDWRWNLFDFMLVILSIADVAISFVLINQRASKRPNLTFLRCLRILKITRVMRMVRAVKWIQELRLMLDCVLNSMIHLCWCLLLIAFVLVMFALVLVQGLAQDLTERDDDPSSWQAQGELIEDNFRTVPLTMLTLFKATTGGVDWEEPFDTCAKAGWIFEVVFLFYIAFFAIVAWNIVMSTFVEKAFKLAVPDIETMMMEKRRVDLKCASELSEIISSKLDQDHNGRIRLDEFMAHQHDPSMMKFFKARELDMKDAELFFHMLAASDPDDDSVEINHFVLGCMKLRGSASGIDVQTLHYDMRNMFVDMTINLRRVEDLLTSTRKTVSILEKGCVEISM